MLVTYGPALPLGLAASAESMEFKALENIDEARFLERINAVLPEGLRFEALVKCQPDCPPLSRDIKGFIYTLDLSDPELSNQVELKSRLSKENLERLSEVYQNRVETKPDLSGNRILVFY